MIIGIPEAKALQEAGLDYLCLAWVDLISFLDSSDEYTKLQPVVDASKDDPDAAPWEDLVEKHKKRAARQLSACASLIYQGAEFLLKSRICQVSPFLLLDNPTHWPSEAAQIDMDFSEFRTMDAQFLPRVHDTVFAEKLSERFKQRLDAIRRRRNATTHSLPKKDLSANDMLKDIMEVSSVLVGPESWPRVRRDYEASQPAPWSDYHGAIPRSLMEEWKRVIELLTPTECLLHLGLDKRRRYACPACHAIDIPPEPAIKLAVLVPNAPESTTIYCLVCDCRHDIERSNCPECPGNVMSEGACLSCEYQPPLPAWASKPPPWSANQVSPEVIHDPGDSAQNAPSEGPHGRPRGE